MFGHKTNVQDTRIGDGCTFNEFSAGTKVQ